MTWDDGAIWNGNRESIEAILDHRREERTWRLGMGLGRALVPPLERRTSRRAAAHAPIVAGDESISGQSKHADDVGIDVKSMVS